VTDFLIRDIDPFVLERLRDIAKYHGRSLQAEIQDILKRNTRLSHEESVKMLAEIRERIGPSPDTSTADIRAMRDRP
jgi:plasmid stability protein